MTQVLLQEPLSGARLAPRVDATKARMIEEEFARRIAEVPDRFREQTPMPGSKEAILRGIADMRRGAPNYDRMSASLAAKVRREASQTQSMFNALGAVESIFFRGVGPGGYDIYGVKFAHGFAEFRLLLGADGKADDVIFRPDGNDAPGGVAACSDEQGLKSQGDTAPIKLLLYNGSGADIQLYKLDSEGKRTAQGMIADNMSSSILAYVDSPWGHRRYVGEMSRDRAAGTTHAVSYRRKVSGRSAAGALGAATHRAAGGKRSDAAPIHRGLGPRRTGLRSHDL